MEKLKSELFNLEKKKLRGGSRVLNIQKFILYIYTSSCRNRFIPKI